jgi:hypothetical protein
VTGRRRYTSRDSHLNAQTLRGIANDHIGRALQIEARAAQDIGGICDHLRQLADDINARAAAIAASATWSERLTASPCSKRWPL